MDLIERNDITGKEWDDHAQAIPESTYLHTSWWLDYQNAINGKQGSKSFLLMEGGKAIAICPLGICSISNFGQEYLEATFKGAPAAYPAIIPLPPAQRRRTVRKVFDMIHRRLDSFDVKRVEFQRHPMNLQMLGTPFSCTNAAEAISAGYQCHVKNTIIIYLTKSEEELSSEISKYHRKIIKKGRKQGLLIQEHRGSADNVDMVFDQFMAAHVKSAGRLTRSVESWDIMRELLRRNMASLFTASLPGGEVISFLYGGEFNNFAFGWSQVNVDEYEKEYSPRHLLEWEAMLSFKLRGFHYYELGIKYDSPQLDHVPTRKEVTISQFKERYGGSLYFSLFFERFFDRDLARQAYQSRLEEYISSPAAFTLQFQDDEGEE